MHLEVQLKPKSAAFENFAVALSVGLSLILGIAWIMSGITSFWVTVGGIALIAVLLIRAGYLLFTAKARLVIDGENLTFYRLFREPLTAHISEVKRASFDLRFLNNRYPEWALVIDVKDIRFALFREVTEHFDELVEYLTDHDLEPQIDENGLMIRWQKASRL